VAAHQVISSPFELATACNPPLWTIWRELLGSFIVYGILLAGRTRLLRWAILVVMAWWYAGNFFQCFVIGVMVADLHCWRGLPRFPRWLSVCLLLAALFFCSYPKFAMSPSSGSGVPSWPLSPSLPWLGGGWPMVGALAFFLLNLHSPLARRLFTLPPLLFLGKVSYSLYGIHFIIIGSFMSWLFLAALPACGYAGAAVLAFLSMFVATLVCAKVVGDTVDAFSIRLAKVVGNQVRRRLWS
jgi:peptidoglycan/LPS O-acetylase OafA/YrhL